MGWDAYADPHGFLPLADADPAFYEGAQRVIDRCGVVDGGFQHGYLDLSPCGRVLERVAGRSMYSEDPWTKEFIKALDQDEEAWNRVAKDETIEPHHFMSAREFVRVCAQLDQGLYFSW